MRPDHATIEAETEITDPVEAALAYHGGDPRMTIETLIADCKHLRRQLAFTQGAMSKGFTRGWQPVFDRPETELTAK